MSTVVAIVVTYHPDTSVIDRLQGLAKQADHVIVVDNTATDSVRDLLTRAFPKSCSATYSLIFNPCNMGIATALNRGIEASMAHQPEWVLTMDQDSLPTEGMVHTMLNTYQKLPRGQQQQTASLAPEIQSADTETSSVSNLQTGSTSCPPFRELETTITSGNMIKPAAWKSIGGFEEKLFIDYVDHDFCFRLRKAGWKIVACPAARLIHAIGGGIGLRRWGRNFPIDQHPPLRSYYIIRNGLYFWNQFPDPCVFLQKDKRNTLKLIIKAFFFDTHKIARLKMFWQGYRDFTKGRFGPYSDIHPKARNASKALSP